MPFDQNIAPEQPTDSSRAPVRVSVDQSQVVSALTPIDDSISSINNNLNGVVYKDGASWTDGSSKHVLGGGVYQSSPQTITDGKVAPVLLDSNGRQVTVDQNSSSIKTAVELIDDMIYTAGSGTPSKGSLVLGTDGTNPRAIKTDTGGELQIDVLSIAAGTNNIGDVDVASIATGSNIIGKVGIDQTTPGTTNGVYVNTIAAGTNTIGKVKLVDSYGFSPEFTPMDEIRVIEPVRLAGSTFVGTTVDTNFWTAAVTNDGTVTQGAGIVTLDTATTSANGTAKITSVATARYIGSASNRYRAQISLNNTGTTDNVRNWGVRNGTTDGAYFQLSGTTLNIVTLKNSSPTAVASGSWNGSSATYTLTNCTTYEIYWTNKSVYFVINGTLVHTVTTTTATWADTLNFQVFAETINSNSLQTSQTIVIRVNTIVRLGKEFSVPRYYYFASGTTAATVLKRAPGTLHRVIVAQSANTGTFTLWDNTAASTTTIFASGSLSAKSDPYTIEFGTPFYTGLTLTVATANVGLTVVYE